MSYETINPREAEFLVSQGAVQVLDVRTPEEYQRLGHIPGATLLPVDLIASAPAVLTPDRPVLVYCEHGVRSRYAADVLARAGFAHVINMAGGMAAWFGDRTYEEGQIAGPSSWLLENGDLLRPGARVLDVACGSGRHTLLLASAGFHVTAVDRDDAAIARLRTIADRLSLVVDAKVQDLETEADLGAGCCDVILVVHYLHRPLFPRFVRALAPGGLLLYETFTVEQARLGRPTNPDFLLRPGELHDLVAPLHVIRGREGEFEGRMIASVAALEVPPRGMVSSQ